MQLDLELRIFFWDAIFLRCYLRFREGSFGFSLRLHVKAQEFPKPLKMRYVTVELENHKAEDFPELLEITRHLQKLRDLRVCCKGEAMRKKGSNDYASMDIFLLM